MENAELLIASILGRTLAAGTPLLLATLGEIYAERSGVMNLGVEGMLAVGAVSGFAVTHLSHSPWLGLLAAAAAGMTLALLHAFVSITLKVNQIVSGLALTMLGLGLSGLWGKSFIGAVLVEKLAPVKIPLLSRIPIVGESLFSQDPLCYLAILLGIVLYFLLYKTSWGISVRSVGENPRAADALGVGVSRVRYLCTLLGGALAGLAGAYLSLVYIPSWMEGMTAGRGWIVIALTIFSVWNPGRAFLGAYLFGGIYVLQYLLQPLGVPPNLLLMLPYVMTLLVLLIGGRAKMRRKIGAPASLAEPFSPGGR